jgi:hypothetical protein
MEVLNISILPWTTRINVDRLNTAVISPLLHYSSNEFRSIFTTNIARCSIVDHGLLYYPQDLSTGNLAFDLDS